MSGGIQARLPFAAGVVVVILWFNVLLFHHPDAGRPNNDTTTNDHNEPFGLTRMMIRPSSSAQQDCSDPGVSFSSNTPPGIISKDVCTWLGDKSAASLWNRHVKNSNHRFPSFLLTRTIRGRPQVSHWQRLLERLQLRLDDNDNNRERHDDPVRIWIVAFPQATWPRQMQNVLDETFPNALEWEVVWTESTLSTATEWDIAQLVLRRLEGNVHPDLLLYAPFEPSPNGHNTTDEWLLKYQHDRLLSIQHVVRAALTASCSSAPPVLMLVDEDLATPYSRYEPSLILRSIHRRVMQQLADHYRIAYASAVSMIQQPPSSSISMQQQPITHPGDVIDHHSWWIVATILYNLLDYSVESCGDSTRKMDAVVGPSSSSTLTPLVVHPHVWERIRYVAPSLHGNLSWTTVTHQWIAEMEKHKEHCASYKNRSIGRGV